MRNTSILIRGGRVHTPDGPLDQAELLIRNGLIESCQPRIQVESDVKVVEARGLEVLPGFVDLQVNGGSGRAVLEGTSEAVQEIARGLLSEGTTSFLPTLISASEISLLDSVATIRKARDLLLTKKVFPPQASILGVHLEGPFLNPEMAGAHSVGDICLPDMSLFNRLADAWSGVNGQPSGPAVLTFAPEIEGAMDLLKVALKRGWQLSFGHTLASYDQAALAVEKGVRLATHLFNRMGSFHHRDPGATGLILTDPRVKCGLIADTTHVHPAVLQATLRLKGAKGAFLVSDATPAGDSPKKISATYQMGGVKIKCKNNRITTESGALAGALLSPRKALENIVRTCGFSLEEALPWVTSTPAQILGLEKRKGQITAGADADIVILDSNWKVRWVCVGGQIALEQIEF